MHSHNEEHKGNYVLTPHGPAHRSCVIETAHAQEHSAPCPHLPTDFSSLRAFNPHGWIESATACPDLPLGKMRFALKVPDAPEQAGALIYLFAGAEDMRMTTVLQPVLQWGCNGKFGGDEWCISSWYATISGSHFHSKPRRVQSGDVVLGSIYVKEWSPNAALWCVETTTRGLEDDPLTIDVPLSSLMLFLIGGALEGYATDCCGDPLPGQNASPQCSQYPASGSTTFELLEIHDLAGRGMDVVWNKRSFEGKGDNCGFHVDIDPPEITLKY